MSTKAEWAELFESVHGRKPSPQEFLDAKAAFLPKGVSLTGSVMSSPNEKADDQSDKSKDRIWGG